MDFIEFQEGDRTFTCRAASSPATPGTMWWWISVTGESQRYAAFRVEKGDAPTNLRPRILEYYAEMRAARERPRELPGHWARRGPAQKAEQPAVAPVNEARS